MPLFGFFGREETLEKLRRSFAEGARLVTLTGSAGVGKSRLAASLAATWQGSAAAVCNLATVRERSELFRAVAQALDLPLGGTAVGEASARAIGYSLACRGDLLLLLDNVDPMLEAAAPTLLDWMQRAPNVRFLLTSRERARAAEEHVVLIDGLEVPPVTAAADEIAASPAVQLFVDRTRRVRADFELTDGTAPIVAALVRELEGNPLAIELCAARGATLGPAQLLSASERRLDASSRGALRGAIERSWELLAPADRDALACFSVFPEGFGLEAAEHVLLRTVSASEGVETLARLVDKSLVRARAVGSGQLRYQLYAAIRDYASKKLDGSLRASAERAHAEYFAALATRWAELAESGKAFEAAEQARGELESSLSSHAWALAQPGTDAEAMNLAVALALALEPVFLTRGPVDGYAGLLDATLSKAGSRPAAPSSLARLHLVRGLVHVAHGAHDAAQDEYERAVSEAQSAGRSSVEALALLNLSASLIARGRYDLGDAALARARLALDKTSNPRALAFFHRTRAYRLARDDRAEDALEEYEAALRLLRRAGDRREEAIVLGQMGVRHLELGNLVESRNRLERAVQSLDALGERRYSAHFAGQLGSIDLEEGDLALAERRSSRAVEQLRAIGNRHLEAWLIAQLGNVAFLQGDVALAARRYSDALLLFDEVGDVLVGGLVRLRSAMARASLGRIDESARELALAERALETAGVRSFTALRRIVKAHVNLARARSSSEPDTPNPRELVRSLTEGAALDAQARFALEVLASSFGSERPKPSRPPAHRTSSDERIHYVFAADASWFDKPDGARIALGRRGALRKIAARLLAERSSKPGVALTVHEIFELGWPGQRVEYELACNRVYAAISRLRSLGLGAVLVTRDDGYLLDPGAPIRIEGTN